MLRFAFLCCAAVLVGCTKSEDQATDDQTARDTAAAASTTISLADVAGKWKVRTMDEDGASARGVGSSSASRMVGTRPRRGR